MQSQNNRNCKTCGKPITSRDKRRKYCNQTCYCGGEFKLDYLKRMAASAVKGTCIEWPYARNKAGYGITHDGLVSRTVYKEFVGELAGDECVLHKCDNPPCFNPHCLFKGSRDDNAMDRDNKGRGAHGKDYPNCKLTPEQVADIRARWVPYKNTGILAKEFGVALKTIYLVATGRSQAHLLADGESARAKFKTRLMPEQRADIKRRWIPYSNAGDLAREYGISVERVWVIANG